MTATPWPGPQRHEFSTTDPELAREFLNQTYGIQVLVSNVREGMTRLAATLTDAGPFTVSDVTLPGDLTFGTTGSDTVSIDTVIAGTIQDDRAKDTNRYQPGDVLLGSWPQASFTTRTHLVRARALTLPVSLLYTVAGRAPSAPLRFVSPRPASAADRTRWTSTIGYIDTLLASPAAAASPLNHRQRRPAARRHRPGRLPQQLGHRPGRPRPHGRLHRHLAPRHRLHRRARRP